jgi:hypothetical protein
MYTDSIDPLPMPRFQIHSPTIQPGTIEARACPAFLVGRDHEGHWLAIEVHGQGGGLFVDRDAALRYAASETGRRPGAVTLLEPDMLDSCDFKGFALI